MRHREDSSIVDRYVLGAGEDWPRWQAVCASAAKQGLHVQLGFMLRYNPAFVMVRVRTVYKASLAKWVESDTGPQETMRDPSTAPTLLSGRHRPPFAWWYAGGRLGAIRLPWGGI